MPPSGQTQQEARGQGSPSDEVHRDQPTETWSRPERAESKSEGEKEEEVTQPSVQRNRSSARSTNTDLPKIQVNKTGNVPVLMEVTL